MKGQYCHWCNDPCALQELLGAGDVEREGSVAGVMDRPAPGSCGVRGVVQHQLIIALRQQTARELRGHGAARLLLPALRRLAATLIPVQLVDRSLKGLTLEELILATS